MQVRSDTIAAFFFCFSLVALGFIGYPLSHRYKLLPHKQISQALAAKDLIIEKISGRLPLPWVYIDEEGNYIHSDRTERVVMHKPEAMAPGFTLINSLAEQNGVVVKIIDAKGMVIHAWAVDWFKIWPDPSHLPAEDRPRTKPHISGIALMDNGDLVFNFEELGLVRLDICGRVLWRLPYRTHHSLHPDESGNFWVNGLIVHQKPMTKLPNYVPPFNEFTVLKVSPTGRILEEISVLDLLLNNGLKGLLYLSKEKKISGDALHLNDAETFPSSLAPGLFVPGDVMISLRNINAIMVFDPKTGRIKYHSVGQVLRQHDPDFIDGNTISVFDNNAFSLFEDNPKGDYSRIVALSAVDDSIEVLFTGTNGQPFFTRTVGKHEWLPNGNLLVTETRHARVFEVDKHGTIIWEYFNIVENNVLGRIYEGQRLAPQFDRAFFERKGGACPTPS